MTAFILQSDLRAWARVSGKTGSFELADTSGGLGPLFFAFPDDFRGGGFPVFCALAFPSLSSHRAKSKTATYRPAKTRILFEIDSVKWIEEKDSVTRNSPKKFFLLIL